MPNKNGYFDTDNRQLTDVFRELQQTRLQYENQNAKKASKITSSNSSTYNKKNIKKASNSNSPHSKTLRITLIFILLLIAVVMALLGSNSISAKDPSIELYSPLSEIGKSSVSIEINRHRLNAHNIITSNAALETVKQQVVEEKDIPFETLYTERNLLPKGEEVVLQTGTNGKKNVTYVRSYDNGELTEETILQEEKTQDFIPQIVDVGTSEFLAKIKAHLKDTLYLTKDSILREETSDTSKELAEIKTYYDVTLLDLPSEDWCKVSYDGIEGYLSTKNLTSAAATPSMPEKNRITKIIVKLDKDGIFLAALGIHESAWGTSQIANDKKNLFGYGSYDATPYESSYEFTNYKDGIELVAKVMVKYYINPVGTKIYDNEKALATYYNGPTIANVNIRYASDENWHEKVYNYMEMLYKRLEK